MVAGIALQIRNTDPKRGRIFLRVRPSLSNTAVFRYLFEQVLSLAHSMEVTQLQFITNDTFQGFDVLSTLNFRETARHEQWYIPFPSPAYQQKALTVSRVAQRARKRGEFLVQLLTGPGLADATNILKAYSLLSEVKNGDYDERLTGIVRFRSEMVGLILVSLQSRTIFIQALAVSRAFLSHSGLINALLIDHLAKNKSQLPPNSSIHGIHYTVQPYGNKAPANFAIRTGGHLLKGYRIFAHGG